MTRDRIHTHGGVERGRGAHVPTERQIQETINLCATTMVRFHANGGTRPWVAEMTAETQAHAAWILDLGAQSKMTMERILRGVKSDLVSRCGHEVGADLNEAFLAAFYGFDLSQAVDPQVVEVIRDAWRGAIEGRRPPGEAAAPDLPGERVGA
jgi:hypothetical protein